MAAEHSEIKNVLGKPLETCCRSPLTGFYRDGCCRTGIEDVGIHTVCARVTEEFLAYSRRVGNDLAQPAKGFPGLKPGARWCLCAARWVEALAAGVAPPVILEATHEATLRFVTLDQLRAHAIPARPPLES